MKSKIAIIGRPNVGKSTLFNRIIDHQKAIIGTTAGITRDRNYANANWMGNSFNLIDTGGIIDINSSKKFTKNHENINILSQIYQQTFLAINDAHLILLILDSKVGPTAIDAEIVDLLRKKEKHVIYIINKVDKMNQVLIDTITNEFSQLTTDHLFLISAEHGLGINDVMDEIVKYLPIHKEKFSLEKKQKQINIAIVGKQNVGKSSLLNKILGYERVIVNSLPGTTRDPIDTVIHYYGKKYVLIDTAGIKKKKKNKFFLEEDSITATIKILNRCDIALIMLDASQNITDQDLHIAGIVFKKAISCIIVVNKWDKIKKNEQTTGLYIKNIKDKFRFLKFAPIIFISALSGQRINNVFLYIEKSYKQYTKKIKTFELNSILNEIKSNLVFGKNQHSRSLQKLNFILQTNIKPPSFIFFTKKTKSFHFSFQRYLINQLHKKLKLDLTPINIKFRIQKNIK